MKVFIRITMEEKYAENVWIIIFNVQIAQLYMTEMIVNIMMQVVFAQNM
jgi:hypothetical protein